MKARHELWSEQKTRPKLFRNNIALVHVQPTVHYTSNPDLVIVPFLWDSKYVFVHESQQTIARTDRNKTQQMYRSYRPVEFTQFVFKKSLYSCTYTVVIFVEQSLFYYHRARALCHVHVSVHTWFLGGDKPGDARARRVTGVAHEAVAQESVEAELLKVWLFLSGAEESSHGLPNTVRHKIRAAWAFCGVRGVMRYEPYS